MENPNNNPSKLGFRCGIEIHQQLDTNKLFCNCPSIVHDTNPDIEVTRKLRAAAGELGEIDIAARHEAAKGKTFRYIACSTSCCLIELDEAPPNPMNKEALQIGLQIAQMLNAKVVDEIQVMRKTVIDGSNVSGFQRTALIAQDGFIETSLGKVLIPTICLEEEAAKKVSATEECTTYRLDRLGIPLIEIATDASIQAPEHAKEVAEKLGLILRSTGKVKRGIGTIRQDVNVSIGGGVRVEIKGFQDLKSMPKVIDNEIARQLDCIRKGERMLPHVRKTNSDLSTEYMRPMPGGARMYPETDVVPTKVDLTHLDIPELIEDKAKRYVKEFSIEPDKAKVLAKSNQYELFERLCKRFSNIKPAFIAETLISTVREIRRKFSSEVDKITDTQFEEIFSYLNEGRISKDSVMNVLIDYSKGEFNLDTYETVSDEQLEAKIKEIIRQNPGKPIGALMGMAMAKLRGKADGKKVMELLQKKTGSRA